MGNKFLKKYSLKEGFTCKTDLAEKLSQCSTFYYKFLFIPDLKPMKIYRILCKGFGNFLPIDVKCFGSMLHFRRVRYK